MNISKEIIKEITQKVKDFLSLQTDKNLSAGAHSSNFCYTASNGKEYVVLLPKSEKAIQDYKKQVVLLPFLQTLNLPALVPTGVCVIETPDLTFAVEEKMNGCEWNYETYASFPSEQKKAFSKQVATFLYQLHQTPTDHLPICSFDDFFVFPSEKTFCEKFSLIFADKIKEDARFIEKIYERAKVIFNFGKEDVVFMHRDFHPQNSFIDKTGNLYGVIDWASCCIAPRIREFQNLAGTDDRQLLSDVLQEYNTLANTNILLEQVVLFNHIEWMTCLDVMKEIPSLQAWAKNDGVLLATGALDKQIEKYINI